MAYFQRRWRRFLLLAALTAIISPMLPMLGVYVLTRNRIYTHVPQVPQHRVAVVFGAGVRPDGRPSRMLADRVQAATELYQAGRVEKLLMTGDNSTVEYNEVAVMQRYAQELGIPAEHITLDYAGFSTYESCYRARAIFGVEQAVLVTQRFHMPRALYTCRQLGIDAVGLGTPDWKSYHEIVILRYTIREVLATLNAVWQVHITRPLPTHLGPFEGIA